jgi:hypothetical protein
MWWECSECGGIVQRPDGPAVCPECGTAGAIFVPADPEDTIGADADGGGTASGLATGGPGAARVAGPRLTETGFRALRRR